MNPTVGRILHYTLSKTDAERISKLPSNQNPHYAGDVLPLLVCRVWPNEFGTDKSGVNGQVFLDGSDSLWVTSVGEGAGEGQWSWPPRA